MVRRASVETLGSQPGNRKRAWQNPRDLGPGPASAAKPGRFGSSALLDQESSNRVLAQLARALGEARDKESPRFWFP